MKKFYIIAFATFLASNSFGAELFVRVARNGFYTATVYTQVQTNSTNNFQFYSLPGGTINFQVIDQSYGYAIHSSLLNIASNQRIVGEIDGYGNFIITQITFIPTNNWNNSYPNQPVVCYPPTYPNCGIGGYPNTSNYASDQSFQSFLSLMNDEAFDSNRLSFAKNYANTNTLSAQQISTIGKQFSFDSNRLDWAKHAYSHCFDKQNYFLLKSTFTFSSNYNELVEYIGQ